MKTERPGHIKSAVYKAGIKVSPIPMGQSSHVYWFKIEVTKKAKDGRILRPEKANTDKRYPAKATKDKPSVYDKMAEIELYYYNKIMATKKKSA